MKKKLSLSKIKIYDTKKAYAIILKTKNLLNENDRISVTKKFFKALREIQTLKTDIKDLKMLSEK
jgi:hypothetical protein